MKLRVITPLENTHWLFETDPNYEIIDLSFKDPLPKICTDHIHINNDGYTFLSKNTIHFYEICAVPAMSFNNASDMGMVEAREYLETTSEGIVCRKIDRMISILRRNGCNVIYRVTKEPMKTTKADPLAGIGCLTVVEMAIFGRRENRYFIYGNI